MATNKFVHILPLEGSVKYCKDLFGKDESNRLMNVLREEISWKPDVVKIYGKTIITKRQVAWYGDEGIKYRYSGINRYALPWTSELIQINSTIQTLMNESYNSCLLNYYSNGNEGMAWHSDDEKELNPETGILSLSFGANRRFCFKHKFRDLKTELILEHGSALLMDAMCQKYWKHSLPLMKKIQDARINLTFRNIIQ
jgi:alkylated DNA repair dioxygenase AlkB